MATREYETDELIVHWDSSLCIHTGRCKAALPAVFDTSRRPWVQPQHGTTDEVVDAVRRCPTSALRVTHKDAGEPDGAPATTVRAMPGGPLFVTGDVEVRDRDGTVRGRFERLALCRCGDSGNQPFCDNSHRAREFEHRDSAVAQERERAEAPDEICEQQDLST